MPKVTQLTAEDRIGREILKKGVGSRELAQGMTGTLKKYRVLN